MAEPQKAMTVWMANEQAAALEAVASVDGVPVAEAVRCAIDQYIDARRADADFRARLAASVERNHRILERLAR